MMEPARAEPAAAQPGGRGLTLPAGTALFRNKWVLRGLSLLVVLVLWQLIGRTFPTAASYPSQIFDEAVHHTGSQIAPAFRETLSSFLLAYAICVVAGIPIGLLMARSRIVELALRPYVSILYATPIVVFIPLLIVYLGVTYELRLVAALLVGIFPIVLNTYIGAQQVERDLLDAGGAFNGSQLQILRTVVVPGSLPYIFAGLRIGFGHAMVATIVAEMEGTVAGVGGMIDKYAQNLEIPAMWVLIILLGAFSVLGSTLLRAAERWASQPWDRKRLHGKAGAAS
jgi:ABC-type nitrate/sulfonate/bicarbonate transport system permease component